MILLAEGNSYHEAHTRDDPFSAHQIKKWIADRSLVFEDELAWERSRGEAARQAVGEGLEARIPFLQDEGDGLREAVAAALGNYAEKASELPPYKSCR